MGYRGWSPTRRGRDTGASRDRTRLARVTANDANEPKALDLTGDDQVRAAKAKPAAARPTRRAIVVEDEALIRMDVVETLREAGFDVVGEAGDGETGVRLALELRPDVVVMDVKMPVMDGITAAEKIAKEHAAAVVLLTAFSQTELVEKARDAGAMAYVVKPFTPADLLPAVEIAKIGRAHV